MKKLALLFWCLPLLVSAQVAFESSNLPIVVFNTNGQEIPDEPKITATMQVIYNGPGQTNALSDPPNHYNGLIGIERRGSSSQDLSDKKPFAVETRDAEGEDKDVALLGMPEEADWVFIAPFADKSLIRDALLLELARQIMPWAPRTRFVELVLNGDYQGIYLVTEKIKRGKDRVDISKLKETDLAGDSLTGGYIFKLDKTTGANSDGWQSPFPPSNGSWQTAYYQFHYPKPEDIQTEQRQYIQSWMTVFEAVMASNQFADTVLGYPKYIDVQSFVDFTLLNELSRNVDGYRLSTFFWKDRDDKDPRLHAGPVWDFNIAFGNANYCNAEMYTGWAIDFNSVCADDYWINHFWWRKMWNDPAYGARMRTRWTELRAGPFSNERIFHLVDSMTNLLQNAQARNFQRWPILDTWVWPNVFCCGTYEQHVAYMRAWLMGRLAWMDGATETLAAGEYKEYKKFKTEVYPNPASEGFLKFKMYVHYDDQVEMQVFDALGHPVRRVVFNPNRNGENFFEWPHDLRPGAYFYEILVGKARESSGQFIILR
jgi:hypothetical protein